MKKVIKESDRTFLLIDFMLYMLYIVCGYILLRYPEIEVLQPIRYVTPLFYLFGFFSLIAYFMNRRKEDYEFLFLGLINILTGSFILFFSYYTDTSFILGNALLIYSITMVFNKGWHTIKLSRENNINMFPKFAITILLTLLGILVTTNLYKEMTLQTLILGYYFISFGVLSLFEPIMIIVIRNKKLRKQLVALLEEENKKEKVQSKNILPYSLKRNAIEKNNVSVPAPESVKKVNNINTNKVKNISNKKSNNKKVIKQPINKKKNINK